MVKFEAQIGDGVAYVSLETTSPNEGGSLIFEGDDKAVEDLRKFLKNAYGAFGHTIGETTSAIDLHYAMLNQAQFDARLIEGEIKEYDPEIPDGAVT